MEGKQGGFLGHHHQVSGRKGAGDRDLFFRAAEDPDPCHLYAGKRPRLLPGQKDIGPVCGLKEGPKRHDGSPYLGDHEIHPHPGPGGKPEGPLGKPDLHRSQLPGPHRRVNPKDPCRKPPFSFGKDRPGPGFKERGLGLGHAHEDPIAPGGVLKSQDRRSGDHHVPGLPESFRDHPGEGGPDHGIGEVVFRGRKLGLKGLKPGLGLPQGGLRKFKGLLGNGLVAIEHPVALKDPFPGEIGHPRGLDLGLKRGDARPDGSIVNAGKHLTFFHGIPLVLGYGKEIASDPGGDFGRKKGPDHPQIVLGNRKDSHPDPGHLNR